MIGIGPDVAAFVEGRCGLWEMDAEGWNARLLQEKAEAAVAASALVDAAAAVLVTLVLEVSALSSRRRRRRRRSSSSSSKQQQRRIEGFRYNNKTPTISNKVISCNILGLLFFGALILLFSRDTAGDRALDFKNQKSKTHVAEISPRLHGDNAPPTKTSSSSPPCPPAFLASKEHASHHMRACAR